MDLNPSTIRVNIQMFFTTGSPVYFMDNQKFVITALLISSIWPNPNVIHTCYSWMPSGFCQGFFCQTEDEFDDWCMHIRRVRSHEHHSRWSLHSPSQSQHHRNLSMVKPNGGPSLTAVLQPRRPAHVRAGRHSALPHGQRGRHQPHPWWVNRSLFALPSSKLNWILMFNVLASSVKISQTRTGWNGYLTRRMKSLRSSPCDDRMDRDLSFSTRDPVASVVPEGKPGDLGPVQLRRCSHTQRSSRQQPLNAPTLRPPGGSRSRSSGINSVCTFSHYVFPFES